MPGRAARKQPGTPPFAHMAGLPARDDPEVQHLTSIAAAGPRDQLETLARSLYQAALAYERAADPAYLTCLTADTLATTRLRADPGYQNALTAAAQPPGTGEPVDVDAVLAAHRL